MGGGEEMVVVVGRGSKYRMVGRGRGAVVVGRGSDDGEGDDGGGGNQDHPCTQPGNT